MVSGIEPQEVPGEDGCELSVRWFYNLPNNIKIYGQNFCKVCTSVAAQVTVKILDGRVAQIVTLPTIKAGGDGVSIVDLRFEEVTSVGLKSANLVC